MPIYEYQCQSCHKRLEAFQKISEDPLKVCPECHKETLTKLMSASGFRLKGQGWYETDFKGGGDNKRNLASSDNDMAPVGSTGSGASGSGSSGSGVSGNTESSSNSEKKESSGSSGNTGENKSPSTPASSNSD